MYAARQTARVAEARGYFVDRGDDVRLHRGLALEGTRPRRERAARTVPPRCGSLWR